MDVEDPLAVEVAEIQKKLLDEAHFIATLPIYYGTTSWEKFIEKFESLTKDKFSENDTVDYLMSVLKGSAFVFATSLPPKEKRNYNILKEKLTEKFKTYVSPMGNFAKLSKRRQEIQEELETYANDISQLCKMALPSSTGSVLEQFKVLNFVHGLRDCKVKAEVATLGVEITLERALQAAKEASGLIKIYKCTNMMITKQYQKHSKVQCFKAYCLGKVNPMRAGENIFFPKTINEIKEETQPTPGGGIMRFSLEGTVGGVYCSITVDTRLEISLVNPDLIAELPKSMYVKNFIIPHDLDLSDYYGGTVEIIGFVEMKLILFGKQREQKFLLAKVKDKIVLGNNTLSSFNLTVLHEEPPHK